jgi:acylphosphatase
VDNTLKCFQITISGNLRGRGLRFSAMYMAIQLYIVGYVEYNHTCGILIEAEGEEDHLEQFVVWLRKFIKSWKVYDIIIVESAPKGYSSFELRNSPCGEDTPAHKSLAFKNPGLFFRLRKRMFGSKK